MTKYIVTIVLTIWTFSLVSQNSKSFSKQTVLSDLETLRTSLVETHLNAFAYTSESDFNSTFQDLRGSIEKDSLSALETVNLYQKLISKLNNGHTEIPFPGQLYIDYAYAGGTLFPLELAFEGNKALIRKNWSSESSIEIGSEVIAINGQPINDILKQIYPHISAERHAFKLAKLELISFPRLYWQVFGEIQDFKVTIINKGQTQSFKLRAVNLIDEFEMKRNEVYNIKRQFEFKTSDVAYLNPGKLSGDLEAYKVFIDSSFQEIKNHQTKTLIIDLRNNPGGQDDFGDYLVSYIADHPFQWTSDLILKSSQRLKDDVLKHRDTTQAYWKSFLNHKNGESYKFSFEDYQPQAKNKRFIGNVYVLINRQSHSQSTVTAAQIQDYGFATLVGEPTTESPNLYGSQFTYYLPETGIEIKVAKGYITRVDGNSEEHGVMPDIRIQDHLLDEQDEILESLMRSLTIE